MGRMGTRMISDKLREKKEESGLTIQQIADLCHIPASTVSRILSGQTESPGFQTVLDIAHCLGCSLGDLDDQEPEEKDQKDKDALIALYERGLAKKNKWIVRVTVICVVELAVLAFLLIYDAINPSIGFFQY